MDHHYVPQFYLKQWADPDGRIPNYRWLGNRAVFGHIKSSKGTGFEPDLYAREHVPAEERHLVETGFFSVLDNRAALIHARLIRMEQFTFTAEERHDWAMFLAAANARTPDMVAYLKTMAAEALREKLNENPEELESALGQKPPFTLYEWTEKNAPDQLANFHLKVLLNHLTSQDLIQPFMDMDWVMHRIPERTKEVLTCDRPFWYMENPQHPRFVMMMPLSPRRVFIASKNPAISDALTRKPPMLLVRRINESVFNRAAERVYGRTTLDYATTLFRRSRWNQRQHRREP